MRLTIGQKLTFSFVLVALLVGVLGILGYFNMRETGNQVDVIQDESEGLTILREMKAKVRELMAKFPELMAIFCKLKEKFTEKRNSQKREFAEK